MCGASDQQKEISDQQQQMYKTLNDNYKQTFGQAQDILSSLTSNFMPILQAGPTQEGYTPEQKTAINNQQYENLNAQYGAAQRATAQSLAARGGGNTLLPSSVSANILAQGNQAAAQARAAAANQTLQDSYKLGRQNWQMAAQELGQNVQLLNPTGYGSLSTGAGSAAATTANQIASQSNSLWTAAIGALGSVGGAALGNPAGLAGIFKANPTQMLSNPSAAVTNYNALQNMPAPPIMTGPGMGGGVPTFGA